MSYCRALFMSLLCLPASSFGSAVLYSSQAAFTAAAPAGLVTEDFEDAIIGAGQILSVGGTLDSSTNNAVFPAGSIAPGLQLVGSSGFYVSAGFFANATIAIYTENAGDTLTLYFTNGGANAVGMKLYSSFSEGPPSPITAYDAQGNVIASLSDLTLFSNGVFFGIVSTTPIDRISYTLIGSQGSIGVDDISFGSTEIPEPALPVLVGIGLVGVAGRIKLSRR